MVSMLKNLFDVLLAALILTIFEIVFFGAIISSKITSTVKNLVRNFATKFGQNAQGVFKLPESTVRAIAEEEAILVNDYNESVMYDGWWIAGIIVILLLGIGGYLMQPIVIDVNPDGTSITTEGELNLATGINTLAFALGTTILFALFQVYFLYYVSLQYNYPTQDESRLIATDAMIQTLEEDLQGEPEGS